uniref:Large ribosomal subunit protein eL24 n=1 Tax=Meloidogyne hapla TaxID=6305 RepID=A0A1I8BCD4_MELHA
MIFQVQIFLSAKCQKGSGMKRNPRDVPWTVLYRRKHKKGIHADEGQQKKRIKRTVHATSRPVADMTVEALLAQRNQKPEFRKQQREAAIKAAKEAVRAKKEETKRKAVKMLDNLYYLSTYKLGEIKRIIISFSFFIKAFEQ